ncbi:MAG: response regulator [Planctomycetes bacterium]|nr:response regulator [Planctomycetota bacterium]
MARILVVDDEPVIRELVRETLAADAHEIRTAATGGEALAAAGDARPDLVLLDVNLDDELDGIEVCRRLRGGHAAPRVILLTGLRGEETRAAGEHAGACAYLTKPFSPLELIEQVERLLGS